MRHVFVQVVRARQDPFAGLRHALALEGASDIVDVRFSDDEFDHIDRVEYTRRRFFRFHHYPAIFRSLECRLDAALADLGGECANVYFADEGVWAVVWARYRRRRSHTGLWAVNVQHGYAEIRGARFLGVRRLLNDLSIAITGYPFLGYGSLGGAGCEPFDLYLTYETGPAQHLREQLGCGAIAAPRVIKHDLIEAFHALPDQAGPEQLAVLFAMNINMRGSAIKCDVAQTLDQLLDLARELHAQGVRLILRLHPGMDRATESARFETHQIAAFAELDQEPSLHRSMARVQIVMSFLSTVLWEAGLLGLLPVQVICACCHDARLTFDRQVLVLDDRWRHTLAALLGQVRVAPQRDWREQEAAEWAQVRPLLLASRS